MNRMLGKLGKRNNPPDEGTCITQAPSLSTGRQMPPKRIVPDKTKYTRKAWLDVVGEWRNDT